MSGFFSEKLRGLKPYVPGEQPKDGNCIKLNTNENPYYTSGRAAAAADSRMLTSLRKYNDPENSLLVGEIASYYSVKNENVIVTNGSDEVLAFCFAAFGGKGAVFPDVTYGFYKVFASLFGVDYTEIPLDKEFKIDAEPYKKCRRAVFIANPNAQTGIYMPPEEIESIVSSDPDRVVVVDEAYIDFGGESVIGMTAEYKNLVIVRTFSKSRSLAGARVGFAVADAALIKDLKRVKYSFNPYNVNSVSEVLAAEALKDNEYFEKCRGLICASREKLVRELKKLGFEVLPSLANFVLAKSAKTDGGELYERLKKNGILVRHFADEERIKQYIRITVGTDGQIDALIAELKHITGAI